MPGPGTNGNQTTRPQPRDSPDQGAERLSQVQHVQVSGKQSLPYNTLALATFALPDQADRSDMNTRRSRILLRSRQSQKPCFFSRPWRGPDVPLPNGYFGRGSSLLLWRLYSQLQCLTKTSLSIFTLNVAMNCCQRPATAPFIPRHSGYRR